MFSFVFVFRPREWRTKVLSGERIVVGANSKSDNLLVFCGNKWSPPQQVGCGIIMITIEMKKRKKTNHKVADDRMPKRVSSSEKKTNRKRVGEKKKRNMRDPPRNNSLGLFFVVLRTPKKQIID